MSSVLDNLSQATHKALKPGASIGDVTGMSQAITQASCHFRDGARSVGFGIFAGLFTFGIIVAGGMVLSLSIVTRASLEELDARIARLERQGAANGHNDDDDDGEAGDSLLTEL
eukprot:m.119408 g.119408  ORF g.119408 m.119408 type:complete len:114 (+) comp11015_c0_seq2:329-670(+)